MTSKEEMEEIEMEVTEQRAWELYKGMTVAIGNMDHSDTRDTVMEMTNWALTTKEWKDNVGVMTVAELTAAYAFSLVEDFNNVRDNGGL